MPERLQKILDIFKLANEGVTASEFKRAFLAVMKLVAKMEKDLLKKIDDTITARIAILTQKTDEKVREMQNLKDDFESKIGDADNLIKEITTARETTLGNLRKRAMEGMDAVFTRLRVQQRLDGYFAQFESKVQALDVTIASTTAAINAIDTDEIAEQAAAKVEVPTLAEARDYIIKEQVPISAIEDLEKRLEEMKKLVSGMNRNGTGAIAYARGQIKLYDLSSQLDGVKTTFSLPAFWRLLTVQNSSFPNAFRPIVDYTSDAAAFTISFTAQIAAASSLAAGQTLTVLYAEP